MAENDDSLPTSMNGGGREIWRNAFSRRGGRWPLRLLMADGMKGYTLSDHRAFRYQMRNLG
jgi:hypothetical protein